MAKYNFELKMKVVNDYLTGRYSLADVSRKYNIPDHKTVLKWVNAYNHLGEAGLYRSRKRTHYPVQFKMNAVELYLNTEMSYADVAARLEMNNPALIAGWVGRYREAGVSGLSIRRGRRPQMSDEQKQPREAQPEDDRIRALEDKVKRLEIENDFLKELRRLREQKSRRQAKRSHDSSTTSGKNTD